MTVVFRGYLAENLRFGHVLELCGKAAEEAKRFHLFLSTGDPTTDVTCNIGLYILINFDKDMITLKKLIDHKWCDEESISYQTSKLLQTFNIYIVMADEKFHISINHEPLMTFKYRIRLGLLNFVEIDGDLEFIRQVDHRKYFPYTWPPIQVVEERLQFSNDAPMPFKPGHIMIISAQLLGNEKGRFIIHLRNTWDSERQELHLSVRFDTRIMVRTSKTIQDGEHFSFNEEERDGPFPFEDFNAPFKLAIAFAEKGLRLAKDGVFLCDYMYRTPKVLPHIGGLKMFGIDGVEVRVSGIDHKQMEDVSCAEFESYSKLMTETDN